MPPGVKAPHKAGKFVGLSRNTDAGRAAPAAAGRQKAGNLLSIPCLAAPPVDGIDAIRYSKK